MNGEEDNVSLYVAVMESYGMCPTDSLNQMYTYFVTNICKQLYKRWLTLCNENNKHVSYVIKTSIGTSIGTSTRNVSALPRFIVTKFIDQHIMWAKMCVQRRYTKLLWGADLGRHGGAIEAGISVEVELDDEYDSEAEF